MNSVAERLILHMCFTDKCKTAYNHSIDVNCIQQIKRGYRMRKDPEANEIYRHFKGNLYQVICIAVNSENRQREVVYQALYAPYGIYVRPLDMFMSATDHVKYPDVKEAYRFTLVGRTGDIESHVAEENTDAHQNATRQTGSSEKNSYEENSHEKNSYEKNGETACASDDERAEQLDPSMAAFLDAGTCEEKLTVLDSIHERITNEMINTMAVASDLEIGEGDLETRFDDLRNCLMTMGKFENRRLS